MAVTYIRQDQATISVPLLPVQLPVVKSWATLEGGDLESEDTKTRPGGMQPQVNLGGPTTRTDATVTRPYTRELHPFIVDLENFGGRGAMAITWRLLDSSGRGVGRTVTLKGIMKNIVRPNFDSNTAGVAHLGIVMGCDVASSIG